MTTAPGPRLDRLWPLLWAIWLPTLAGPAAALAREPSPPLRTALILAAAAVFAAVYLWTCWFNEVAGHAGWGPAWAPVPLLAVLSVALVLLDGHAWLVAFVLCGGVAGGRLAGWAAAGVLALLMAAAVATGAMAGAGVPALAQPVLLTAVVGFLVMMIRSAVLANRALAASREEVSRLAVEAERLRFARDLHDVLGHHLAGIALRSDLAAALVAESPARAAPLMAEVAAAARDALQQMRATVAAYRQPTLAGELLAAREILAAAGIAYEQDVAPLQPPAPALEAVLGWAVREGVTNVVKHSRARRCLVRGRAEAGRYTLEVVDDRAADDGAAAKDGTVGGVGDGSAGGTAAAAGGGNGLAGLRERVAALKGTCEAGPRPDLSGFRVAVTLPAPGPAR